MNSFLAALSFLTVIPVYRAKTDAGALGRSGVYFPLVGFFIGLILVLAARLLDRYGFGAISCAIIITVLLMVITRGLHLDGLADTSDALLSCKGKDDMLKIMRDPHVGVMGVLAIISVVLVKIALIASLDGKIRDTAIVLMCIFSRWSLVLGISAFPYARSDGKAKAFKDGSNIVILIGATIASIAFAFALWPARGAALFAIAGLCAYLMHLYVRYRIGGITGDTLGAVNELIEIVVLVGVYALGRGVV